MFESAGAAQLTTVAALAGASQQDQFSGRFADVNTRLGTLAMAKQIVDVLNPSEINGRIEFPFSFSIPPCQGTWRVRFPGGKVGIVGALHALRGKGTVSVQLARPNDWAIDIGQGDFAFDAGVEAVLEPLIYGSKPQFGA